MLILRPLFWDLPPSRWTGEASSVRRLGGFIMECQGCGAEIVDDLVDGLCPDCIIAFMNQSEQDPPTEEEANDETRLEW